jgi:hypothetical protein
MSISGHTPSEHGLGRAAAAALPPCTAAFAVQLLLSMDAVILYCVSGTSRHALSCVTRDALCHTSIQACHEV